MHLYIIQTASLKLLYSCDVMCKMMSVVTSNNNIGNKLNAGKDKEI